MSKTISELLVITENLNGGRALRIAVGVIMMGLLLVGGAGATRTIKDDATGGDCLLFGTWDIATNTCAMTIDLTEELMISSNDVTLDGNGHTITGYNVGFGISLFDISGVVIKNVTVNNFYDGVSLYNSSNNYLSGNNISNNNVGIGLAPSSNNNTLISNKIASNTRIGIYLGDSSKNNTLINNNALNNNGWGIEVMDSSSHNTLSGNNASNNYGGIILNNSIGNTLNGNSASNNQWGISVFFSINNELIGNNVSKNKYNNIYLDYSSNDNILLDNTVIGNNSGDISIGIQLRRSSNILVTGNNVSYSNMGIYLFSSSNDTISNNTVLNTSYGIFLDSSSDNNTLIGNNLLYNNHGIRLSTSSINKISSNNASNNNKNGIYLTNSSNNIIYNNYFNNINNYKLINNSGTKWNITKIPGINIIGGPYLGGNFWAYPNGTGFSLACTDSESDGICDSPYVLDSNNTDYLPLSMNYSEHCPPSESIRNLKNKSYAPNYINWTWTEPVSPVYSKVMVYINGVFMTNVTKGVRYYNAASLIPNTSYRLSTHTVDVCGKINRTWVNHTARTAPDRIAPRSVTNLTNRSYAATYINWTWKDPVDADLAKVMVFIDGIFKANIQKGKKFFNATGVLPNTKHTISTHTVDTSGNVNLTWKNHTAWTKKDTTKPASISNLRNISYATNFINWTWKDPSTPDFSYVRVYIDGKFNSTVPKGKQFFKATGFQSGTMHKISTRTVDTSGNVNMTWRNHSAWTK